MHNTRMPTLLQALISSAKHRLQAIKIREELRADAARQLDRDRAADADRRERTRHERGRVPTIRTRTGALADQSGRRGRAAVVVKQRPRTKALYIADPGYFVLVAHPGENRHERRARAAALPRADRLAAQAARRRATEGSWR